MALLGGIDALLVTNPMNIRYLTGFVGASPEEREAYLLFSKDQAYLFITSLYKEQTKSLELLYTQNALQIAEISREEPFAKKLAEILTGSLTGPGPVKRLGFEESDLKVTEYHKIMHVHKNVTLVPTNGRVEELRMIKRSDEIENIRKAAKLTDECYAFILNKIKPRVTEAQIAWQIESFIRTHGAGLAFSPIVAFGSNTSQPHYSTQPQGPALSVTSPNIILLDFGAKVNGYCGDMTRVVFVGKPKKDWVKAYDTVLRAQTAAIEYLASRPGLEATGGEADRLARKVIEKAGFPIYPHSLGHGVGLDIHEAPRLTVKKDAALKPNMVITVEPAIYVEGNYGIRLEDLVVLKEDGVEVLSQSQKDIRL